MTRATSREAYQQLIESGALAGKQAAILGLVVQHGAGTAAEILAGSAHDRNRNLARARFTELQARGLIVETETRKCKITGRNALVWEYTGRTKPLDAKKGSGVSKKTLAATIDRLIGVIEHNIDTSASLRDVIDDAKRIAARA